MPSNGCLKTCKLSWQNSVSVLTLSKKRPQRFQKLHPRKIASFKQFGKPMVQSHSSQLRRCAMLRVICYDACMTTHQITEVLERVRTWPQQRQQDAARILLEMEQQDATPFRLTSEQAEDVGIGLAEADRGIFATDNEINNIWSKFGL
jgi:predicted transcriptional regulator